MNRAIFNYSGTITRKGYFLALLIFTIVYISIHYLFNYFAPPNELGIIKYAVIKNIMAILYLILFMPFIAKRSRDISISLWWSTLFWLSLPLNNINILLFQEAMGIQLNFVSLSTGYDMPLNLFGLFSFGAVILSLLLLFKKSSHNKAFKPTPESGAV